jgi:hypothetical protein
MMEMNSSQPVRAKIYSIPSYSFSFFIIACATAFKPVVPVHVRECVVIILEVVDIQHQNHYFAVVLFPVLKFFPDILVKRAPVREDW